MMLDILLALVALVLLTSFGNVVCRLIFSATGSAPDTSDTHRAGWIIGWLERLVLALGIAAQRWEILAAVIALKSVARFKELNEKRFAEYFLIGSLFSFLWAILITTAWVALDSRWGSGLSAQLIGLYRP